MPLLREPTTPLSAGSMVLRDASGLVVDSLNYGGLVDPWAAEGYQATSGAEQSGCHVPAPGAAWLRPQSAPAIRARAASRTALDTDSNCTDFLAEPATALAAASDAGATNIKVASVAGFGAGQTIRIDTGANLETAVIASVGTAGATTVGTATEVGATVIPVASVIGFRDGQTITIGSGANYETAVVVSINRFGATITVAAPLTLAHAAGAQVSGTGITLTSALTQAHASAAQVAGTLPRPVRPTTITGSISKGAVDRIGQLSSIEGSKTKGPPEKEGSLLLGSLCWTRNRHSRAIGGEPNQWHFSLSSSDGIDQSRGHIKMSESPEASIPLKSPS